MRDSLWSMAIVGVSPAATQASVPKQWTRNYWTAVQPYNLAGLTPIS
ncbi:hypothetical protein [Mesorhizobium sp. AR07]|nr:hypothetical protein [Mesorhizobium sp. AR07]